jgi:hypothetical protein
LDRMYAFKSKSVVAVVLFKAVEKEGLEVVPKEKASEECEDKNRAAVAAIKVALENFMFENRTAAGWG